MVRLSSVLSLVAGALPSKLAAITLASQIGSARLTALVITGQLEWRSSNRAGDELPNSIAKLIPVFGHYGVKVDRIACPSLIRQFANPQPEFINTEENDVSRYFTNDGVHVYSEWLDTHEELPALLCRGEVHHATVGEAVSRAKVDLAQRFRVALANVQPLTGRL